MSKTVEELVYDFANRQFHKAPINTARDLMCVCSDFANEFLALPLASRLTAEEKERMRKEYANTYPLDPDCGVANILIQGVLERIFGKDFFKEGE